MRSALPLLLLGLFACTGEQPNPDKGTTPPVPTSPKGDTGTGPVDTGIYTNPYDRNGPITDSCPDASAKLAALEVEDAKAAYEACIAADADNAGAYIGLAMTELLLLPDRTPFTDALTRCGETNDLVDNFYGATGELHELGVQFGGTSTIAVDFVDNTGTTNLPAYDDPTIVYSEIRESWYWGDYDYGFRPTTDTGGYWTPELREYLTIDIASSFTYSNEMRFRLDVNDVYGDGTDVALAPGLQIDAGNLPRSAIAVWTACGQPGSSCNGWYWSTYPMEGTISVVQYGPNPGDTVELTVNARVPAYCQGGLCSDRFALDGSLTDTISGEYDPSWVPFYDTTSPCEGRNCYWDTEPYTTVADLCTIEDHLTLNNLAQDFSDELKEVGDTFATAAEKLGRHEVRFDDVFVIGKPMPMGAGEMRTFAALLHAASAAARLASSYDYLDPAAVPADLTVDFVGQQIDWGGEYTDTGFTLPPVPFRPTTDYYYYNYECVDVDYYGLPIATLGQHLADHLLDISTVQDFPGARAGLLEAFKELRDALASATGETELYDFAYASTWAIDALSDLNVIIRSLEGTDGSLATAPQWDVTLNQYFDQPTRRASLLAVASGSSLVEVVDSRWCDQYLTFDEAAAEHMASTGFGMMTIPESARYGNGPYPILLDGQRYDELIDQTTGEPKVITEPLLEIFR